MGMLNHCGAMISRLQAVRSRVEPGGVVEHSAEEGKTVEPMAWWLWISFAAKIT